MTIRVTTGLPLKGWTEVPEFIGLKNRPLISELVKAPGFIQASEVICSDNNHKPFALTVSDWQNKTNAYEFAHSRKHLQLMEQYSNAVHLYEEINSEQKKQFPSIQESVKKLNEPRKRKGLSPIELWEKFPYGVGIDILPKKEQLIFCLSKDKDWLWYRPIGLISQSF